eukprot:UN30279
MELKLIETEFKLLQKKSEETNVYSELQETTIKNQSKKIEELETEILEKDESLVYFEQHIGEAEINATYAAVLMKELENTKMLLEEAQESVRNSVQEIQQREMKNNELMLMCDQLMSELEDKSSLIQKLQAGDTVPKNVDSDNTENIEKINKLHQEKEKIHQEKVEAYEKKVSTLTRSLIKQRAEHKKQLEKRTKIWG